MAVRIRIADPEAGAWNDCYIVEYDPMRDGLGPEGEPLVCHLVVSNDASQAKTFPDLTAAFAYRRRRGRGVTCDGEWQRPLTGFMCCFEGD